MTLLIERTPEILWQAVVKHAENSCSVTLKEELEAYLVSLLIRYIDKPELVKQIFGTAFLNALQRHEKERHVSLRHVGDQCLLFTGLFPHAVAKRQVNIRYFVEIGRSAYATISQEANDLYGCLALQFVVLMDILQSIRPDSDLMPLEAYEQWETLGSQRALRLLKSYTHAMPIKNGRP